MSFDIAPPAWLVARPIAHRGLHDRTAGRVENSCAAALAAIEHGFAIECDVQLTADGEAVVFHDVDLARLTGRAGIISKLRLIDAEALTLLNSSDTVVSLPTLLALVGGAVPLICEIKSGFDGDIRLAERVAAIVTSYAGPLAIKSFDPAVIRHLRTLNLGLPLGIISEALFDDLEWAGFGAEQLRILAQALHFGETRPDFLSYRVGDLPHAVPYLCRTMLGLPVMTWTVRTPEQRQRAARWADQMVFEGFIP